MSKVAKRILGEAGLPNLDKEILRILEEGRPETRIARLLVSNGWSEMDARENLSPRLDYVVMSGVLNSVRYFEVTGKVHNELYHDSARSFRSELRRKRLKKT
jgi:hypothetical protein